MITGQVDADDQAVIPLEVRRPDGQWNLLKVVIDTGFSGHMTLSPAEIAALAPPFQQRQTYMLGDGSKIVFDVYLVTIRWDGHERDVPVLSADGDRLIGMRLLRGFHLFIDVVDGGEVRIETRP